MNDDFPLVDAEDIEVLMHRDAHFGGQFAIMLDYYAKEGKGALLEMDRIERLAQLEAEAEENIAPYLLEGAQAEEVAHAQEAYRNLRLLYEMKEGNPRLIADLILAEEDEEEEAIARVVEQGDGIIDELVQLLQAAGFDDPLFPGYGEACNLAAQCLGKIGSPRAIAPLFESARREDEALDALVQIGESAREFLLKILAARPLTPDTELAASALSAFPEDETIGKAALQALHDPDVLKASPLSVYLAICCAGLKATGDREELRTLLGTLHIPDETREEISSLLRRSCSGPMGPA